MAHPSGASSAVINPQPTAKAAEKPKPDSVTTYFDNEGAPSFEVHFKDGFVKIKRVGEPDVTRKIINKYGNVRAVDGHMKQAADAIVWYLFGLTDSN